jgi:hypothetical protein
MATPKITGAGYLAPAREALAPLDTGRPAPSAAENRMTMLQSEQSREYAESAWARARWRVE